MPAVTLGWWALPAAVTLLALGRVLFVVLRTTDFCESEDVAMPLSCAIHAWALYLIYLCVSGQI